MRFDDGWFGIPNFFYLPSLCCHAGAYPISFGGLWILTGLHDHHYSLDAHQEEHPESHPVRPALLGTWMPSCFSIREVRLGSMGVIQLWIRMIGITCLMRDGFMSFVLRTCRAPDTILGHVSISDEIYGPSWRSHVRR